MQLPFWHPLKTRRYDYQTGAISDDVAEQAEQTLRNVEKALKDAGASIADVVRVTYIVPDRSDFPQTWPVLQKWFGDVLPAATMMQAALMKDEMKFEIVVTAKKGGSPHPTSGDHAVAQLL